MHTAHTFLAPAKLNLFLHVTGVREDSYHLLQTVFQLLDFYDRIQLKVTDDGVIKRLNKVNGVPEATDLCIRAATLLKAYTQTSLGVEILVEKNIPMGGGLGGGSSDAATVLLALNQLWQLHLDRQTLMDLGLQLGADVPIFIFGQNAWAEGVGEQLAPIQLRNSFYVVLNPNTHVSTAKIFAHKQLTKNTIPKKMSDFSSTANSVALKQPMNVKPDFVNQLEKCVCEDYQPVNDCLTWLKQFGDARMTGSGASVFLEVDNEATANEILQQAPKGMLGFFAKGLDRHPLYEFVADV